MEEVTYKITLHTHVTYNLPYNLPYWLTKAVNLWTYFIHSHPCQSTVNCTPISSYYVTKTFPQFQEIGHLILGLDNPLPCLFANLHRSNIWNCYPLSAYLQYHYISDEPNTYQTSREWNYCLHPYCKQHKGLVFFCNLSHICNTNHHFCLLDIYHSPTLSGCQVLH